MSRIRTIALLVDYVFSSYQAGLLGTIEYATREQGFSLLTVVGGALDAPLRSEATQNRIYELLDVRTIDGIIMAAGCLANNCGPAALARYCLHHFKTLPMCSVGACLPGIPSLVISNRQGIQAGVEHLIVDHGARRIGFIGGPRESPEAAERYDGYLAALAKHGLPQDPRLVTRGAFTSHSGIAAARELLGRRLELDAIVAANDYMAAAVMDVAHAEGLHIPRNLRVVGFDDAPFARFTRPSLTTVRQPLELLGRMAVDSIAQALQGALLPDKVQVDVELVKRQSCGCGLVEARRPRSGPPASSRPDTKRALGQRRAELIDRLHSAMGVPPAALDGWAGRLLDALGAELDGKAGRFLQEVDALLTASEAHPEFYEEFVKLASLLRDALYELSPPLELALELEQLWHETQVAISNAATNAQGRTKIDLELMLSRLRVGFERIATSLNLPALTRAVGDTLPSVNIQRAAISLAGHSGLGPIAQSSTVPRASTEPRSSNGRTSTLVPLLATCPGNTLDLSREFPAQDLAPAGFFPHTRHSHVVLPLTFEEDWLGVLVVEHSAHEAVYVLLRDQVSSALKGTALHRVALRETTLREQAEREHLQQEAKLAARIQTAILPGPTHVEGLSIAARMAPAAEVGGDYYDIVPCPGGAWLGIGDVSGHGLLAGLVMLMVQGMVSALVRNNPTARPRDLIVAMNEAVIENVSRRLQREDHVTLALIRYERNGRLTLSGAHDEPILYRRRTGRCELIPLAGVWLGLLEDISELSPEINVQLEDGDILVLYSDGLTEAMNERGEMFGTERLIEQVQAHARHDVEQISLALMSAVSHWQSQQRDDMSVLVARYAAEGV